MLAWEVPIVDICQTFYLKPASVPSSVLQALMWILPRTGQGLLGQVANPAVQLHTLLVPMPQKRCNAASSIGALCARCRELGSGSGQRRAPAKASSSTAL